MAPLQVFASANDELKQQGLSPAYETLVLGPEAGAIATSAGFRRVEAARILLEDSQVNAGTAARLCRFGHPETLRRAFQRQLSVSPSAYAQRFCSPCSHSSTSITSV